jgi:hypothetical protein
MTLGEANIRFPQVTASLLPSTKADDTRFLFIRLRSRASMQSTNISLTGRDILRTKSSCCFTYDISQANHYTVEFTLIEQQTDRFELAKLAIPLDWFPPNYVVRESFHMYSLNSSIEVAVLFLEIHRRESADTMPWTAPYATIVPRSRIAASFTGDSETAEFESPIAVPPIRDSFSHEVFSCEPATPAARKADTVFRLQTADVFDCRPMPTAQKMKAALGLAAVNVFECPSAPAAEKVPRPFDVLSIEIFRSPPQPLRPCAIAGGDAISVEPQQEPAAPRKLEVSEEEEEEEDWIVAPAGAVVEELPFLFQDHMDDSIPDVLDEPPSPSPQPQATVAGPISQPGALVPQTPPPASMPISHPGVVLVPEAPPPRVASTPPGAATSVQHPAVVTAEPAPSTLQSTGQGPPQAPQQAVAQTQLPQLLPSPTVQAAPAPIRPGGVVQTQTHLPSGANMPSYPDLFDAPFLQPPPPDPETIVQPQIAQPPSPSPVGQQVSHLPSSPPQIAQAVDGQLGRAQSASSQPAQQVLQPHLPPPASQGQSPPPIAAAPSPQSAQPASSSQAVAVPALRPVLDSPDDEVAIPDALEGALGEAAGSAGTEDAPMYDSPDSLLAPNEGMRTYHSIDITHLTFDTDFSFFPAGDVVNLVYIHPPGLQVVIQPIDV